LCGYTFVADVRRMEDQADEEKPEISVEVTSSTAATIDDSNLILPSVRPSSIGSMLKVPRANLPLGFDTEHLH
jgi:hypothetical protein